MAYRRRRESEFTGVSFIEDVHKCCKLARAAIYIKGVMIGMHIAIDEYDSQFIVITHCPWCGEEFTESFFQSILTEPNKE